MTEEIIRERMKNHTQSPIMPHEAVDMRVYLAGMYSFYMTQLEKITLQKAQNWATLRANHKSDKSAELEWKATENGQNELGLDMRIKSIKTQMSALKSIVDNSAIEFHYAKVG